jgi:hypothetical protein
MPTVAIGLTLALAASLSQSGGYLFQHMSAAVRPPVSIRRPIRTLGAMLTAPWWRVGLLLAIVGFLLHLAALALAPISLVQAFVAGGLAMAVPLAARAFGHRLTRPETRAVFLMAASLAALSFGIAESSRPLHFDGRALGLYLCGLSLIALLLATAVNGRLRHPALGLSAGLFYGVLDSSTKAMTDLARAGGMSETLRSPFLPAAILAGTAAFFCFQRALQTNRPLTAIAVMEAGAVAGGVLAGFAAFGDSLGASPATAVLHALAFIGVGVAAWSLAPAQARLAGSASTDGQDSAVATAMAVEPLPGNAKGGRHLGAPQSPVVYSRRLGGPDRDP